MEGKRVWIGYGNIRINVRWWRWDENEVLRDERGWERIAEEEKVKSRGIELVK